MSNRSLLIRQARVLLPDGDFNKIDVLAENGKISRLGEGIEASPDTEIVEGEGLTLLPGVIDPQVHFREPGLEYKEDLYTASRACARGGVTSFLEMPNTRPLTITQEALNDKLARAGSKSIVNYGFFIGATAANLPDLLNAEPVCGIKIFMGSMHGDLLVSEEEALEPIFARGSRLIAVHAEDQARIAARRALYADRTDPAVHSLIQDEEAALNATKLALKLSKKYRRRLHILHLSTGIEAEYLRQHKPSWVSAEVTPQHLVMSTEDYDRIGTLAQMNPPLRDPGNQEILWKALLDGVIDCIATDHAPHTLEEKAKGYPNTPSGMPGVETSLPIMLTWAARGYCSVQQVSGWMSTAPARLYNIPNKGLIAPGYDADLILVDLDNYRPVLREELQTKCGWSPFEGWNLTGWPRVTIVNGNIVYRDGEFFTEIKGKALSFG